jgi:protein-S-isoprenylcysteine O-methyltransferase Ste14
MSPWTKLALVLFVAYVLVTFVLRTLIQWRRTGSTGLRGSSGRPGSAEWWGFVLLVLAFIAMPAALVLDLTGWLAPLAPLVRPAVQWTGLVLFLLGFVATFASQLVMGTSWRIGVQADEVTALVTAGPFSLVRNPIFTAMLMAGLGFALMVPNFVSFSAWALALSGIELQVRLVEEPYLRRVHGEAYGRYEERVGRLLPGLGRKRVDSQE